MCAYSDQGYTFCTYVFAFQFLSASVLVKGRSQAAGAFVCVLVKGRSQAACVFVCVLVATGWPRDNYYCICICFGQWMMLLKADAFVGFFLPRASMYIRPTSSMYMYIEPSCDCGKNNKDQLSTI